MSDIGHIPLFNRVIICRLLVRWTLCARRVYLWSPHLFKMVVFADLTTIFDCNLALFPTMNFCRSFRILGKLFTYVFGADIFKTVPHNVALFVCLRIVSSIVVTFMAEVLGVVVKTFINFLGSTI